MISSVMNEDIVNNYEQYDCFSGNGNNIIIWHQQPEPEYLVIVGSHIEDNEIIYSAYAWVNNEIRIESANGDELIAFENFHFTHKDLNKQYKRIKNQPVINDIILDNFENGIIELTEFESEYRLA